MQVADACDGGDGRVGGVGGGDALAAAVACFCVGAGRRTEKLLMKVVQAMDGGVGSDGGRDALSAAVVSMQVD